MAFENIDVSEELDRVRQENIAGRRCSLVKDLESCEKFKKTQIHRQKDKPAFLQAIRQQKLEPCFCVCCICGWERSSIDLAHLIAWKDGGKYSFENIVPVCPNHHRLIHKKELMSSEYEKIHTFLAKIKTRLNDF